MGQERDMQVDTSYRRIFTYSALKLGIFYTHDINYNEAKIVVFSATDITKLETNTFYTGIIFIHIPDLR